MTYMPAAQASDTTLLASAIRSTIASGAVTITNQRFLRAILDVTTLTGGTLTVTIDGFDNVSGKWSNLLTGAAVGSVSTNAYTVGPAMHDVVNKIANDMLVKTLRVYVTPSTADLITYSVGVALSP